MQRLISRSFYGSKVIIIAIIIVHTVCVYIMFVYMLASLYYACICTLCMLKYWIDAHTVNWEIFSKNFQMKI